MLKLLFSLASFTSDQILSSIFFYVSETRNIDINVKISFVSLTYSKTLCSRSSRSKVGVRS